MYPSVSRLWFRYRRPLTFGVVGVVVMLASYAELWAMMGPLGMPSWWAYAVQTVVSLELNFLLNHLITFGDKRRDVSFWRAFIGFHISRVGLAVPLNLVLFPVLVDKAHWSFYVAQTVCLAITFILNYLSSKYIYKGKGEGGDQHADPTAQAIAATDSSSADTVFMQDLFPSVSVVVPVRNSQATIRRLVESLVSQDYPGEVEVILVGSINDKTWNPIRDFIGSGQVTVFEAGIVADGRDANPKRNLGLARARGRVLALTDSDMEAPRNWISTGVQMLREQGVSVVAGSMISLGTGFWSDYVDRNVPGSKTPRMDKPYLITQETIGRPGYKLPITANVFLDRTVFDTVGGLHEQFTQTYDDYVWFRDIVAAGYSIWCDSRLAAYHRHREGFRSLLREYWSSGCGAMDYMALYPEDRFSRMRGRQLGQLLYAGLGLGLGLVFAPLPTLAVGVLGWAILTTYSVAKVKLMAATLFPTVTLILSMAFLYGIGYRFVRQSWRGVTPTETVSIQLLHDTIPAEAYSGQ